jgi:hypothetical protein
MKYKETKAVSRLGEDHNSKTKLFRDKGVYVASPNAKRHKNNYRLNCNMQTRKKKKNLKIKNRQRKTVNWNSAMHLRPPKSRCSDSARLTASVSLHCNSTHPMQGANASLGQRTGATSNFLNFHASQTNNRTRPGRVIEVTALYQPSKGAQNLPRKHSYNHLGTTQQIICKEGTNT